MTKKLLLFVFVMMAAHVFADDDPVLAKLQEMQTKGALYNVKAIGDSYNGKAYTFDYLTALDHSLQNSPTFYMQGLLITTNTLANPLEAKVNQVVVTGYSIQSIIESIKNFPIDGNSMFSEVAHRYGGNVLLLEHRYFGNSCYGYPWQNMEYNNAKQAAADFDYIIRIFRAGIFNPDSKMVFTGGSKGGVATSIQACLYPEDANLFIPYAAPWCQSKADPRVITYLRDKTYSEPAGNSTRTLYEQYLRRVLNDKDVRTEFFKWLSAVYPKEDASKVSYDLIASTGLPLQLGTQYTRSSIDYFFQQVTPENMDANQLAYYVFRSKLDYDAYREDYQKYFPDVTTESLDTPSAKDTEATEKFNMLSHVLLAPDEMTKEQFYTNSIMPYYYQAAKELGYYSFVSFDDYYDDSDLSKQYLADYKVYLQSNSVPLDDMANLKTFSYSDALYKEIMQKVKDNKNTYIYFLYAADDPWTGAAIEDQYINGTTVLKETLPAQCHQMYINAMTDATKKAAIWKIIDDALNEHPTGIDNVRSSSAGLQGKNANILGARKVISNGRLVIVKDGKEYTISGQQF